jgi:hypothetical protein
MSCFLALCMCLTIIVHGTSASSHGASLCGNGRQAGVAAFFQAVTDSEVRLVCLLGRHADSAVPLQASSPNVANISVGRVEYTISVCKCASSWC